MKIDTGQHTLLELRLPPTRLLLDLAATQATATILCAPFLTSRLFATAAADVRRGTCGNGLSDFAATHFKPSLKA